MIPLPQVLNQSGIGPSATTNTTDTTDTTDTANATTTGTGAEADWY